jgi:hypothetical protein
MGTGSVERLDLNCLERLPTVPVPFFGRQLARRVYEVHQHC